MKTTYDKEACALYIYIPHIHKNFYTYTFENIPNHMIMFDIDSEYHVSWVEILWWEITSKYYKNFDYIESSSEYVMNFLDEDIEHIIKNDSEEYESWYLKSQPYHNQNIKWIFEVGLSADNCIVYIRIRKK